MAVRRVAKTTKNVAIEKGVLMVEVAGKPYCWSLVTGGSFTAKLPAPGWYDLYVEARAHAPSSKVANVKLLPGDIVKLEFTDVKPPGYVNIRVTRGDNGAFGRLDTWFPE